MNGELGATDERRPLALETPARVMGDQKQQTPSWQYFAEWAHFKALTTRNDRFSPHNYNWTAERLYPEKEACWVGCRVCTMQCLVPAVRRIAVQVEL